MTDYIYKICPAELWQDAVDQGVFTGAGIDLIDGYIHFSTADQTAQTAYLHFTGMKDLVLVKVKVADLDIKWEASRGGALFPHLYADLPLSAVESVTPMDLGADGLHCFPDEISPLSLSDDEKK